MNDPRAASLMALLLFCAACGAIDLRLQPEPTHDGGTLALDASVGASGEACSATPVCDGAGCPSSLVGAAVMSVAAGGNVACVLRQDQSVWCWGSNQYAQLGSMPSTADQQCGELHCNPVPQRILGLTGVVAVSVGSTFVCAREADGSVWCWGRNAYDELGHSDVSDPVCADPPDAGAGSTCDPMPSRVPFPPNVRIGAITAGLEVACALSETDANGNPSSDVYCWGENDHDSLGIPGAHPYKVATPNKIGGFAGDILDIALSDDTRQVCAVRRDGTVWCWGDDWQGRIGVVPGTFPQADCGGNHCTAVPQQIRVEDPLVDGGADGGDLGLGAFLTGARQVQLGDGTSCALRNDNTVWCWGYNGAAGLASPGPYTTDDTHPGARPVLGLPSSIRRLVRHFAASFTIDDSGTLWGWGENSYGEMGAGAIFGQDCVPGLCIEPPIAVMSLRDVKEPAAGDRFFAAINADNSVWAWGRNDYAQLGHAPGSAGDGMCTGEGPAPCNAVPSPVTLP
jgi:alpha-tubulin suppressor-like RCC1 family protein